MFGRWLKRKWEENKWRWQMQATLLRNLLQSENKKWVVTRGDLMLRKGKTSLFKMRKVTNSVFLMGKLQ